MMIMKSYHLSLIHPNTIVFQTHVKSISTSQNGWQITKKIGLSMCVYLLFVIYILLIFSRQNFLPTLKDHLLGRITERPEESFNDQDRRQVLFQKNQIFCHKTLRINFTTYDCRRDQDIINIRTHSDIMVLANQAEDPENRHPYW